MALLDTAAQNASLDNDYGATKGPNSPASLQLALFRGDPSDGGVELDAAGGYARVTVTNDGTNFPAAADGQKTCAAQNFPTSTAQWTVAGVPDVADYFAFIDASTGTRWDSGQLSDPVSVGAAGIAVSVVPVIFYNGGFA